MDPRMRTVRMACSPERVFSMSMRQPDSCVLGDGDGTDTLVQSGKHAYMHGLSAHPPLPTSLSRAHTFTLPLVSRPKKVKLANAPGGCR